MVRGWTDEFNRLGRQIAFYAQTLRFTREALVSYRGETMRLIAQMGLGVGALAVIGGTVAIVGLLTLSGGAVIGIQGFATLSDIGIEAMTGFFAAYIDSRLVAPLIGAIALAATVGAGATAQIGAMRINEEIDALEVMGVRTIAYLASTRVLAGVVVIIPLYCVAELTGFWASRFLVVTIYGQSAGIYDHYFYAFLKPADLFWALLQIVVTGVLVMLIHTYYGFNASGGPAGVGDAVGRSVRASIVVAITATLVIALGVYGQFGDFNLS
jgi:phospholipid/cholesterol/gamma-HCH transport system permease protein